MPWSIFAVLVVPWPAGFLFHVAGGLIHVLFVLALLVFIAPWVTARRDRV